MCNPGQNIWNKLKKSWKIGQAEKALITASAGLLTAFTKVLFLEGTRVYLQHILTFF